MEPHHGFLWSKSTITNLGPANNAPCSNAFSINSARQIVGDSTDCHGTALAATLWENGSTIDLNTLVGSGSGLQLASANYITEDGQIAGYGTLADGNQHAFLLIPCDDDHSGIEGCDYSMVDASTASVSLQPTTGIANPANQDGPAFGGAANPMVRRFGRRFGPWYRRAQAQPTK